MLCLYFYVSLPKVKAGKDEDSEKRTVTATNLPKLQPNDFDQTAPLNDELTQEEMQMVRMS